jgi:proteic killer suppression protein
MDPEFDDEDLRRLESDPAFDGGFGREVVKAFRKRMQVIRAAPDERDFYALKGLHYEQLQADRAGQHSMRLNKQWRLILRYETRGHERVLVVVEITDYH